MSKRKPVHGTIEHRDSLDMMQGLKNSCVDLIYLDPPNNPDDFNGPAPKSYGKSDEKLTEYLKSMEIVYGSKIASYLFYMSERIKESYRILSETGTLYLHCNYKADRFFRPILDIIFGNKNCHRNNIVWFYNDTTGRPKCDFPRKHDTIFRFVKDPNNYKFNADAIQVEIAEDSKKRYEYNRTLGGKTTLGGSKTSNTKIPEDVWKIPSAKGKERNSLNYKENFFQKPETLMERIILASSNPGNVVFDPFCGTGTTFAVADRLDRQWIGCDNDEKAYNIAVKRLGLENQVLANEIKKDVAPKKGEKIEVIVERIRISFKKKGLVFYKNHPWIDECGPDLVEACHILPYAWKSKATIKWLGKSIDLTKGSIDFGFDIANIIMQSKQRHGAFDKFITSYDPNTGKSVYSKKLEHTKDVAGLKALEINDSVNLTEGQKKFMQWHFEQFKKENPDYE